MKTKPIIFARSIFHWFLFIWFAVIAGILPSLAQTTLNIAPTGDHAVLSWSTTPTNYVLQSTTNLASPNWVAVNSAGIVNFGNSFDYTVSNTSSASFFRLYLSSGTPVTNTPAGMALVPDGSFTMGDSLDSEIDAVPTNIIVSAFYMDTNLVSYSQWKLVYSYATNLGYGFNNPGAGKAADHPVQTVDWFDCVKWSNARSQQAGLMPVYYADAGLTQVFTNGEAVPFVNWAASGYRLPTEAEWEKAARGGLIGKRFPWGDTISESQANYQGNTNLYSYDLGPNGYNAAFDTPPFPYTSPVGAFAPNGYGLYDMAGNEYEWCWDWYGTPYGQPTTTNPTGVVAGGSHRVLRGGNWLGNASAATCAFRSRSVPGVANGNMGFRCVRGL